MSSSMLAESIDNTKSDNSVIIFVNSDGTLTVDQVTLRTLLSNQSNVPLNVVKVTEKPATENAADGINSTPQINLQVEEYFPGTKQPPAPAPAAAAASPVAAPAPAPAPAPPPSIPIQIPAPAPAPAPVPVPVPAPSTVIVTTPTTSTSAVTTPVDGEIDPFLEMDPEQLERLETALQSEQAKQILGENVAAMLDMLNVEDDSNNHLRPSPTTPTTIATSVKDAIRMDHCYTTLTATITSPVPPPEAMVTSPVLLTTNTNTARVRGRGRGGYRGAIRGRGRILETAKIPVVEPPPPPPPPPPPVETLLDQEMPPVSPLRQAPSPIAIDDNITINSVNQTSSAKVVVSKLPDIIDGTSAGLTLTEAMLDAKLQETQPEFTTYPAADEDSSEEATQSQDEDEEEEEEVQVHDDSSSDQDFVISPQKRTPTAVRGRGRKEHPRGGIRRRGGRGRGRGGAQPLTIITNQSIERSPPKKTEEHTPPVQSTRRPSTEKKVKIKIPKEPVTPKEPTTSTSTPTTPTTTTVPITISRTVEITKELQQKKNYPKRENRKPPAHLADSFGPALFSTPDIIRRVSTGEKESPEKKNPKDDERTQQTLENNNVLNNISDTDLGVQNPPLSLPDSDSSAFQPQPQPPSPDIQPRGGSVEITQDSSGPFEMNSTILSLTSEDPETLATPLRQSKRQNSKTRRRSSGEKSITKSKRPSVDSTEAITINPTLELINDSDLDEVSSEDESCNSEDDPDRLWCICKKPHNNRFMICCDQCEDWFHGKCVGVTKALGKQMEAQGIEWSCPNCKKLKEMPTLPTKSGPINSVIVPEDENPLPTKNLVQQRLNVIKLKVPNTNAVVPKTVVTTVAAITTVSTPGNPGGPNQQTNIKNEKVVGKALCIVCKKEARANSIYCSDTCILKHAQDSQAQPPSKSASQGIQAKLAVSTSLPGSKAAALNIKKAAVEVKGSRPSIEKSPLTSRPVAGPVKETPVPISSPSLPSPNPPVKKGRSAAKASYQAEVALKQKTLMVQQGGRVVITPPTPSVNTQNTAVSKAPATSTVKESKPQKKVDTKRKSSDKEKEKEKEKDKEKDREEHKVSGPDSMRANVRSTIQELLQTRVKDTKDLDIPEDKIKKIALNVEEELYSLFGDTAKYKAKYRSLFFNIKDPKNLTLYRKIVEKMITPYQLVRLTPEELASQELAEWRERETKHQLEIIQKNELDLLALGKTYVMKTHKGEQFIEREEGYKTESTLDPKNQDLVNVLNNSVSSTVEDQEPEKKKVEELKKESQEEKKKIKERKDKKDRKESRDNKKDRERDRRRGKEKRRRRSSDRKHDDRKRERRDRSREKDKDRTKEREKERDRDKDKEKDKEKNLKLEKISSAEPIAIEKVLRDDSDQSDREPSSTVIIKTPEINGEEPMTSTTPTGPPPGPPLVDSPPLPPPPPPKQEEEPIWTGYINMPDVSKFNTDIRVAYGNADNLSKDMPEAADIVGRISPETVWEYMAKMKRSATKEIVVVYMSPVTEEDKIPYTTLYNYLNSRSRLGVIGNLSKMIKDFYLMPLPANESIPTVLLPVDGQGFGDSSRNLLIGILVRARRKRVLAPENTYMARNKRPLIVTEAPSDSGGYTPPQSPTLFKKKEKELAPVIPPPPPPPALGNEDEPYSPGQADGEELNEPKTQAKSPPPVNTGEDLLTEPKSPTDLHRKMEEINRQIAESKRQIQTMSSTLTTDNPTSTNDQLPVLTKAPSFVNPEAVTATAPLTSSNSKKLPEKEDEDDDNEAYSPSRSFTPPTTINDSIPFLGASSEGSTNVLSQLPSNISLPSNLSEILASIKKRECESVKIDLNSDPIVQSYKEGTSPIEDDEDYEPKSKTSKLDINEEKKSLSSSATSSPSLSLLDSATESRDPRQRAAAARGPQEVSESSDSSGSKLSKLTDDELIRKAMEMEAIEANTNPPPPSTKKETPMIISPAIHNIMKEGKSKAPSPQPKPPGLEDEPQPEFTGYPPPPPLLAFTNKPPPGPPPGAPIPFPNMGPRHPRFFPPHPGPPLGGPPLPGPPHPGMPHQGPPHQGSPHGGPPHQGPPHGGPPHQGPPHGGPPHQGPPHGGLPHQGPSHGGPPHQGPPHGGPPHQGPLHGGPPHQGPPHGGPPHQGPPHGGPPHQGLPHGGPPHQGLPHGGPPHQGPPHGGLQHSGPPHQGQQHPGPPHPHSGMFRPSFRQPPPGHPGHLRPPVHMGPHGHPGPPRHPGHQGQFRPPPMWDSNIPRPPQPLINFRKHDSDQSSLSPSYSNQGHRGRSTRWENKSENKDSNKVSSGKRKKNSGDMDST